MVRLFNMLCLFVWNVSLALFEIVRSPPFSMVVDMVSETAFTPLTSPNVIEAKLMDGEEAETVTFAPPARLIVTVSTETGTPVGSQFSGTYQLLFPPPPSHEYSTAKTGKETRETRRKITAAKIWVPRIAL